LTGFREHTLKELAGFNFFDLAVYAYCGAAANHTMEVPAVPAKAVTIGEKSQGVLPANKFASNRKNRTIRVQSALLVQHVYRSLDRVQHHDVLTHNLDMRDITCGQNFGMHDIGGNGRCPPYFLPHIAKVSQGLM
jgi:hypothetical protein